MPRDKNRRGYGSRARFLYQLKEAGVSSYAEYLRSDHWRELKASNRGVHLSSPVQISSRRLTCDLKLETWMPIAKSYSQPSNS
jgi:hypothetical protein